MSELSNKSAADWQVNAKIKLLRLQSEGRAAGEAAQSLEQETHSITNHRTELERQLRAARERRATAGQLQAGNDRVQAIDAEINGLLAEIEQLGLALADANSRHAEAREVFNAKQGLAYEAKRALESAGVRGLNNGL